MSATASHRMPGGLESHRLRRRLVQIGALVVVVAALTAGLLPGTGSLLLSAGPVVLAIAATLLVTLAIPRGAGRLVPGVLAYRAVLLGVPTALGATAFVALKRSLRDEAAARIPCADDVRAPEPAVAAP